MFVTQTAQTVVDESSRCRDRSWLSMEDQKRFGVLNPVSGVEQLGESVNNKPDASNALFEGRMQVGQQVFLPGDQFIGQITKLFLNPSGQVSHLAIRTGRLFGRHKLVPIALVSEVTTARVQLSIDRDAFMKLPGYQTDLFIAEEVDRVLWKDLVLRDTDYQGIDVRVRDGVILLNGHVMTSMNQWRAETAVKDIPGILDVKSYLIPDDKLNLEIAGVLGQIEQDWGREANSKFFTKVENGVAVLVGETSSTSVRDQAEQCVAEIPWVRAVINEIRVPGIVLNPDDQRFLQPLPGKELVFKDTVSATIRKVVINPHNRRVVAVVVLGRFPALLRNEPGAVDRDERNPERLVVLPVHWILHLTSSAGFIGINSDETTKYEVYDPASYITPGQDWLPPYPYCTDEVLFPTEKWSHLARKRNGEQIEAMLSEEKVIGQVPVFQYEPGV